MMTLAMVINITRWPLLEFKVGVCILRNRSLVIVITYLNCSNAYWCSHIKVFVLGVKNARNKLEFDLYVTLVTANNDYTFHFIVLGPW